MRSWRSSSFRPAIMSWISASVASPGALVSTSVQPSSIGLEPDAGSVIPSFTSISRARTMRPQTLSKAMSMLTPLSPSGGDNTGGRSQVRSTLISLGRNCQENPDAPPRHPRRNRARSLLRNRRRDGSRSLEPQRQPDLRTRAYADQGGRLRRGDTAPHAAQGRVQNLGRRTELARLLPSQAQGLPASEILLRRGLDLQSDPPRRERIPRRVVSRDRRPRQGPRAARLPHGSVRELRGSQGPRRGAREGAEDAVGRVARRRQTGSKGRSPPAGFSA